MTIFLRAILVLLFSFAGLTTAVAAEQPADEDFKALTILARNCAGCHQEADHPGALFLNKARLTEPETIALIRKLIETSQMPPAHVSFRKSKDGKFLLKWLKKQQAKK